VAAEVSTVLAGRGVPSILLKGPVLDEWLYERGARDYIDADLLVPPDRHALAETILQELGFSLLPETVEPPRRGILHSRPWGRVEGGGQVDLHRTLFGTGVGPETVWAEVSRDTMTMDVAGTTVAVLSIPARAFLVANHAAQHEGQESKALEDLRRATERVPMDAWREAARLAECLNATPTMSLGLSLVEGGPELARSIGLVSPALARAATREGSRAGLAIGFERLARAEGWWAKVGLVAREFFPTRDFIYGWSPLARRSRRGMALVYLGRPLWLLASAGPSLVTWLRHRGDGGG
jgi:hypothetical protein